MKSILSVIVTITGLGVHLNYRDSARMIRIRVAMSKRIMLVSRNTPSYYPPCVPLHEC